MDLLVVVVAFGTIFLAELPDTTFLATLVLATRYRLPLVWIGVSAAFAVQTLIAVSVGAAASRLPRVPVLITAICLFLAGAVVLLREARAHHRQIESAESELAEAEESFGSKAKPASGLRAVTTSFVVLFLAEAGDPSQLLTVSLAARFESPVAVFVGALAALLAVSALALLVGRALLQILDLHRVLYAGSFLCLLLAALAGWELLGG